MSYMRLDIDESERDKLAFIKHHQEEVDAFTSTLKDECARKVKEEIFYCIFFNYRESNMDDLLSLIFVHFEHDAWLMALPPRRPLESGKEADIAALLCETVYTVSDQKDNITLCRDGMGKRPLYKVNDTVGDERRQNIKVNLPASADNDFETSVQFVRNVAELLLALPNDDEAIVIIKKFVILFLIGIDKKLQQKVLIPTSSTIQRKNEIMVEYLIKKCDEIAKAQFNVGNIDTIVKNFVMNASMVYTGALPISKVRAEAYHNDGIVFI